MDAVPNKAHQKATRREGTKKHGASKHESERRLHIITKASETHKTHHTNSRKHNCTVFLIAQHACKHACMMCDWKGRKTAINDPKKTVLDT